MLLSAGGKLGLYEVVALLGKGGMGGVHNARNPEATARLVDSSEYLHTRLHRPVEGKPLVARIEKRAIPILKLSDNRDGIRP